jgi:hypothetical protein
MPDMQQPIAATAQAADAALLLRAVDDDLLGFECAHPLLQIDCWADDLAAAGGTPAARASDGH